MSDSLAARVHILERCLRETSSVDSIVPFVLRAAAEAHQRLDHLTGRHAHSLGVAVRRAHRAGAISAPLRGQLRRLADIANMLRHITPTGIVAIISLKAEPIKLIFAHQASRQAESRLATLGASARRIWSQRVGR